MSVEDQVAERADRIAALLEERLGVRGRGLEAKLNRAGRLLPRWVRREADQLVAAQRLMGHPKLKMQSDASAIDAAFTRCERWLKAIDPTERRKDKVLGFLAVNAANLILVGALFVGYLVWAGHV